MTETYIVVFVLVLVINAIVAAAGGGTILVAFWETYDMIVKDNLGIFWFYEYGV